MSSGDDRRTGQRAPRIAAIVLAAGRSRRMGTGNKLLALTDGLPMIVRVAEAALASRTAPVIVVTGHDSGAVRAALAGRAVNFAHNPDFAAGLSTSLKAGLAALPDDIDGTLVCLGDMPLVTAAELDRLVAAHEATDGEAIVVPTRNGRRGNPVLWSRRFFSRMHMLAGDLGARHLITDYADHVVEVGMDDDGVLIDIDTPEALARVAKGEPI
jgi:molybdenum cofactor cytidylyltransferase